MVKYSEEIRIKVAIDVLEGGLSENEAARKYGMNHVTVNEWAAAYSKHGAAGLINKGTHRTFTGEQKQYILEDMHENRLSYKAAAKKHDVQDRSIRNGERIYRNEGPEALYIERRGRTAKEPQKELEANKSAIDELIMENQRLRMEVTYLKKNECLSSEKKLITNDDKAHVIYELRHEFNVKELVKIAGIPRSTYYYHVKKWNEPDKYADVKTEMRRLFNDELKCRAGYRTMTREIRKTTPINHKTVQRLMKELGLHCMVRRKKYRLYKGAEGKIAPNVLKRDFNATAPNKKWVTDVTEFHLFGQKIYLSPIMDLYNREIISYTIFRRPTLSMVTEMLEKALEKLPERHNLILHSDQGWQYQQKRYQFMLSERGVAQSMSRRGNCLDNSVIENFFGILKTELLYIQEFESIEHFIQELDQYIHYYNHRRTKQKLRGLSPVEYRIQSSVAA
ncbi:IS3 family transposase [Paenibacillus polymyxa]|uniref:IS3 family transposase n=1 Tax=Paenibacillus polymyxa TaxID=1406 RepID=UPI001865A6AF|nr:IS3 family transposase [Paenibacillus polymyxa]MBE3650896.1 IS3 family transposase [Paenibacillus polymyxa]